MRHLLILHLLHPHSSWHGGPTESQISETRTPPQETAPTGTLMNIRSYQLSTRRARKGSFSCPFILLNFAGATTPADIPSRSHHHRLPLLVRGGGPVSSASREMSSTAGGKGDEFALGGGAINEKERLYAKGQGTAEIITSSPADNESNHVSSSTGTSSSFDPNSLSHSLHAAVGMERYPNYLSRWSFDDMDQLEASLRASVA